MTVAQLSDDAAELIHALHLRAPDVWGQSLGAGLRCETLLGAPARDPLVEGPPGGASGRVGREERAEAGRRDEIEHGRPSAKQHRRGVEPLHRVVGFRQHRVYVAAIARALEALHRLHMLLRHAYSRSPAACRVSRSSPSAWRAPLQVKWSSIRKRRPCRNHTHW